jgi:hypothetical protein
MSKNEHLINLKSLWQENQERYKKAEVGSQGNEGFVKQFIEAVFELTENNSEKNQIGSYKNQLKNV